MSAKHEHAISHMPTSGTGIAVCERCWGKAFRAAYGIGSKTQTGEYERIVASCKCTPWQRLGVANGFAEGYEARLAEDAKVRAGLVEALSRLVRANEEWNADVQQVIGRMPKWTDGYLDDARAALAAAKEIK